MNDKKEEDEKRFSHGVSLSFLCAVWKTPSLLKSEARNVLLEERQANP